MSQIQYGCQTYPWKMKIEKFAGDMPHIVATTAAAGFTGLEAEICMLGDYFDRPDDFAALLAQNGVRFAALVLHQPWEHPEETEDERLLTEKAIAFVRRFPRAKLMVSHHAKAERGEGDVLAAKRECLIRCMSSVADRAAEAGVVTCFHPNSGRYSLFRTAEDYKVMFEMLEKTDIGYAPDVGHIVNGGMDALAVLRESRSKIRHVHFKDRIAQNEWAVMGEGSIDYPAIIQYLADTNYGGWIMVEDESPKAAADSDAVVMADGAYIAAHRL